MKNQTKRAASIFFMMLTSATIIAQEFIPILERVNIQTEIASEKSIIDNEWVAIGIKKKHAIGYDNTILYKKAPSYRFYLQADDNTLVGYSADETKGRAELSYCYATAEDVRQFTIDELNREIFCKTVYHNGKGIAPQGSTRRYQFATYIPSDLSPHVQTIFAQWHGMPSRTLVQTPKGDVKTITKEEFMHLCETMIFKKNIGVDKQSKKPNGWLVEQGGYPPLAFGFSNGYFYIKANSDRKWLTDKDDRCNSNPSKVDIMQSVTSEYKSSTIAYKMPFADFPKDEWVEFEVEIEWTTYGKEAETIKKRGRVDVKMNQQHIVKNESILIGRNDDYGYYFKFGIYRVGGNTVPVKYNLAGYKEW